MLATLYEHHKKLKEFGARHENDALQILRKLEVSISIGTRSCFCSSKNDEEHERDVDVQKVTAGRMVKVHCESSFAIEEGSDGEG